MAFQDALASLTEFRHDIFTLGVAGAQDLHLTYQPLPFSLHLMIGGIYQREGVAFTVAGQTLTLTDVPYPPVVGLVVAVEYAHERTGWLASAPAPLYVPIGATWRFKTGLGASATIAQPGYDDSTWPFSPSPFGWGYGAGVNTICPSPLDVWQRLAVNTLGGDLTFSTPGVDNNGYIYLDGALIWSPVYTSNNATFTIASAAGAHTIAIRGTGDGVVGDRSGFAIQEAVI